MYKPQIILTLSKSQSLKKRDRSLQITHFWWPYPPLTFTHGDEFHQLPSPLDHLHDDLSYRYFSRESCDLDLGNDGKRQATPSSNLSPPLKGQLGVPTI